MTNKQALREEFQYMQEHYSDPADRARQVIYIAAEALLDENLQLQREKDAIEAVALALRDDMQQAREQLEAAEKHINDYHTVLNNFAAVARRYLPDYDEHPDIQAADDLLESAAGIGVKGE
ncbi:TPA: hypothetical protein ACW4DX_002070 [Salmonella enterica subsp. enterica serovar Thompson]